MRGGPHDERDIEGPHPLALDLAAVLEPGERVLVVGPGRGRSLPPLAAAGVSVETLPADAAPSERAAPYDAILSTHALLHGTRDSVAARVRALTARLRPGGRLYATFGSTRDPRSGSGVAIAGGGWAPADGDEAGVAHAFFDRPMLDAMLGECDSICAEEHDVRDVVGRWAHARGDGPSPSVHWFVKAQYARR
jgi:hypothetical protein